MILHQIPNSVGNYNYNAYIYNDMEWSVHFHGNYELIYTAKGVTMVTVNGVSDKIETGELMLISPYTTHSLNIPKDANTWVAVFSKDYITDFANNHPFKNFLKFRCEPQIEEFLQNNLFQEKKPEHYLLMGCLYLVCAQCIKNSEKFVQNNNIDFIKDVINYITENVADNITMKQTAYKLNYEYHYFSSLFNKYFSMNFKRFVNLLRFEQACEILSKTELNMTEVCEKCGFESIRNFNRIFKEFSGMTPREYKNSVQFHTEKLKA